MTTETMTAIELRAVLANYDNDEKPVVIDIVDGDTDTVFTVIGVTVLADRIVLRTHDDS